MSEPHASACQARASCLAEPACLRVLLALLDRCCEAHRVDPQSHHDLHLIVEEACANVIAHAYPPGAPGPVSLQVEATLLDGRPAMRLTIEDEGVPFDPLALPVPVRAGPVEHLPIGGLGVHLIRRLSDLQRYHRDRERGNVLTLTKFLAPAGPASTTS